MPTAPTVERLLAIEAMARGELWQNYSKRELSEGITDLLAQVHEYGEKLSRLTLNETTRDILGRPGFTVRDYAHMLRDAGYAEVKTKTEDEQAVALFWMLMLYIDHGDNWRKVGGEEIARMIEKIKATPAP